MFTLKTNRSQKQKHIPALVCIGTYIQHNDDVIVLLRNITTTLQTKGAQRRMDRQTDRQAEKRKKCRSDKTIGLSREDQNGGSDMIRWRLQQLPAEIKRAKIVQQRSWQFSSTV